MKKFPFSRRFALVFVGAGALGLAIALGGRLLLSDFIDAAYDGDSFEFINKKLADDRLEDPAVRTMDYYQQRGAAFLNRMVWLYFIVVFPIILGFRRLRRVLVEFFAASAHPFHLALFRIVVFSLLFIRGNLNQVYQLDSVSLVSLPGWGWVLPHLLLGFVLDPDVMETSRLLFQLCCLAGIVGFYTRTAAVGAAALGLYVLGMPQFFAKISHYHFLWWFAVLLACSPSGDALSIDAARRAWRSGIQGMPLQAARRYALPLQFALLLLGVAYFFPGFWKFAVNGPEWALSDNLKFKMRYIWFVQGGWLPFFRLDLYPFLYQAGGLLTILFEIGFVIGVLHPRTRMFSVAGATLFHLSNRLFLNVGFPFMVAVVYAAALNWRKLFHWCGRIFKRRIALRYRPDAKRNLAAVMQTVDLFGAVDYQADRAAPKECPLWNGAPLRGIRPWIAALLRVPFMGLALPVLFFPMLRRRFRPRRPSASTRPTAVAGALLLAANILCGAALIDSWPFAVYPTFAGMDKGQVPTLLMAAQNDRGEVVGEVRPFFHPDFRSQFGSNTRLNAYLKRLAGLKRSELLEKEGKKMEDLWNIWKASDSEIGKAAHRAQFYRIMVSTSPEELGKPLGERELLYTLTL